MIQVKFALPKTATVSSAPGTKLALSVQGPYKAGLRLFQILTTLTTTFLLRGPRPGLTTPRPPGPAPLCPTALGHSAGCWAFQPTLRPFSRRFLALSPAPPGPSRPPVRARSEAASRAPSATKDEQCRGKCPNGRGRSRFGERQRRPLGSAGARHDARPAPALARPGARRLLPAARRRAGSAQARAGRGVRAGWAPAGSAHCARASRPARPLQEFQPPGASPPRIAGAPSPPRGPAAVTTGGRRRRRREAERSRARGRGPRERAARRPPPPWRRGSVSAAAPRRARSVAPGARSSPPPGRPPAVAAPGPSVHGRPPPGTPPCAAGAPPTSRGGSARPPVPWLPPLGVSPSLRAAPSRRPRSWTRLPNPLCRAGRGGDRRHPLASVLRHSKHPPGQSLAAPRPGTPRMAAGMLLAHPSCREIPSVWGSSSPPWRPPHSREPEWGAWGTLLMVGVVRWTERQGRRA